MEAELASLEQSRLAQLAEVDALTMTRKALEADQEKHKAELRKLDADRK